MQNSGNNYSSSILFNSHLFTINGAPLKFYLDGYSPTEFNDIVKIIEAYGGKLTKPDVPDTFVFSEPGRPVGAGEYDLYDIEYFYDSIVALQPQQLIKYKLQVFTKQQMTNLINENESLNLKIEGENDDESEESIDYNLQMSTDDESSTSVDDDESSDMKNRDKMTKSHSDGVNDDYYGENCIDRSSSRDESHDQLINSENSSAAARTRVYTRLKECFIKVERLNEEITFSNTRDQAHEDNISDGAEATCQSSSGDDGDDRSTAQVGNISGNRKSIVSGAEDEEEESLNGDFVQEEIAESREMKTESRRKSRLPWTEEEHRVIVKYLIDNDCIHRAKTNKVWRECLTQCKQLLHSSRTVEGLRARYRNHIRYLYGKYTDDPEILEKFRKVGENSRRIDDKVVNNFYWSYEENCAVVQYLIDNDAIHKGGSEKFWMENYKEIQPKLSVRRTANAIRTHFNSKIRQNYKEYTDDPEALRKFKEAELIER